MNDHRTLVDRCPQCNGFLVEGLFQNLRFRCCGLNVFAVYTPDSGLLLKAEPRLPKAEHPR